MPADQDTSELYRPQQLVELRDLVSGLMEKADKLNPEMTLKRVLTWLLVAGAGLWIEQKSDSGTPRDSAERISKLQAAVTELQSALASLTEEEAVFLSLRVSGEGEVDFLDPGLDVLEKAAGRTAEAIRDQAPIVPRGRPPDQPYRNFVWRLADIYREVFGTMPPDPKHHAIDEEYTGDFVDLVRLSMPSALERRDPDHTKGGRFKWVRDFLAEYQPAD